jgi:glycosyltransferase involved in cell wall biosynthesis
LLKKIAVVCSTDPRNDFRIIKQIKFLKKSGYKVKVFGVSESAKKLLNGFDDFDLSLYKKDILPYVIRFILVKFRKSKNIFSIKSKIFRSEIVSSNKSITPYVKLKNKISKAIVDFYYVNYLTKIYKKDLLKFGPNIIHAHELPAGIVGSYIKGKIKCKLIYDSHELETSTHAVLPSISWWYRQLTEKNIVRNSDNVITVSNDIKDHLNIIYNKEKIDVIYNTPDILSKSSQFAGIRSRLKLQHCDKLAVYIGSAGEGRGLDIILKAVNLIPALHLAFLGIHSESEAAIYLKDIVRREKLSVRLYFISPIPNDKITMFIAGANVSLIATQDICLNHKFSMPNKLFESAFAGVPIVSTPIQSTSNFINELGIGEVASDYGYISYSKAIRIVLDNNKSYYNLISTEKLKDNYGWLAQEKKMLQIYDSL